MGIYPRFLRLIGPLCEYTHAFCVVKLQALKSAKSVARRSTRGAANNSTSGASGTFHNASPLFAGTPSRRASAACVTACGTHRHARSRKRTNARVFVGARMRRYAQTRA
eukprot:1196107-Prorocentrum_minimum.AAC.1